MRGVSRTKYEWYVVDSEVRHRKGPYPRQADAFKAGRKLAQKNKAEFFVHARNGTIRMKNSYGNDPRDIKG